MKNFNSLVNKILMTESPIFSNSELSVNLNNNQTKNEALYQPESFEQYWSDKTIIHNKAVGYYNLLFKIYYK